MEKTDYEYYKSVKDEHPEETVIIREAPGYYYSFDDDAKAIAEAAGLTLRKHDRMTYVESFGDGFCFACAKAKLDMLIHYR